MRKFLAILALLVPVCAHGQVAYRVDPIPAFTTSSNPPPGAYTPVLAIPGATVSICGDLSCATSATTYTDATAAFACPTNSPSVRAGTTACVSTTDNQGNFGFWLLGGTYAYKLQAPSGQVYGPFPITVGPLTTGQVTPQQFGASGNGSHDDTAGIQGAMNTCRSVFFPSGSYRITATINATCSGQSVTFAANAVLLKATGADAWQVSGSSSIYTGYTENGGLQAGSGLGVFGFYNQFVGGSIFNNGGHGIYFDGQPSLSHACGDNYLSGIYAHDNSGIGIAENDCAENRIIGNYAFHNGLEGITVDNQSHYAVISGNRVDSNCSLGASAGIGTDFSNYVSITGNTVSNSTHGCGGVKVNNALGSTIGLSVTGNTIYNNNGWGVALVTNGSATTTYSTVSGNTLNNNTLGPYSSDVNSNNNDFTGNIWNSGNPGGPTVNGVNVIGTNILSLFAGSLQNTWDAAGRIQAKGAYADQSYVVIIPTTGSTYNIGTSVGRVIIDEVGTIAALTLVMPAGPVDGQFLTVNSTQAISSLAVNPSPGQTVKNAPTSMTVGQSFGYTYVAQSGNWYRLF